MDNLRKSEIVISAILSFLLQKGLQKGDMSSESLALSEDEKPFFVECFKWLLAEGVVRAANTLEILDDDIFVIDPQITSQGFEKLGHEITFAGASTTLSNAVQEVSRNKASYSQVGDFVGSILGGFTKSMSS